MRAENAQRLEAGESDTRAVLCFNSVDGAVFDLTSAQFGDRTLAYGEAVRQSRDVHFAKEEKRLRYESLRKALAEALGTEER